MWGQSSKQNQPWRGGEGEISHGGAGGEGSGTVKGENQETADLFNSFFASVFQKEESEPLTNFEDRHFTQELNTSTVTLNNNQKRLTE